MFSSPDVRSPVPKADTEAVEEAAVGGIASQWDPVYQMSGRGLPSRSTDGHTEGQEGFRDCPQLLGEASERIQVIGQPLHTCPLNAELALEWFSALEPSQPLQSETAPGSEPLRGRVAVSESSLWWDPRHSLFSFLALFLHC